MPDEVAESRNRDDHEQDELDDDPSLTAGTECREPSAHAQMVRLKDDGRRPSVLAPSDSVNADASPAS